MIPIKTMPKATNTPIIVAKSIRTPYSVQSGILPLRKARGVP
jgi:hypothetical protein